MKKGNLIVLIGVSLVLILVLSGCNKTGQARNYPCTIGIRSCPYRQTCVKINGGTMCKPIWENPPPIIAPPPPRYPPPYPPVACPMNMVHVDCDGDGKKDTYVGLCPPDCNLCPCPLPRYIPPPGLIGPNEGQIVWSGQDGFMLANVVKVDGTWMVKDGSVQPIPSTSPSETPVDSGTPSPTPDTGETPVDSREPSGTETPSP